MAEIGQLRDVLVALMSSNNQFRREAEAVYNQFLSTNLIDVVATFLAILRRPSEVSEAHSHQI